MTNFNTQFGCGEFIPGQKPRLDPPPKRPVPRKIIPINRRTPTIPPMPGGGEYEYIDPRSPNPGNPGRPGSGTGTPVPPGNGGPSTPGPGAVPPGSAGGSPTPVGPTTPGPGGPGIPTPVGPTTPGPGGPGTPGPLGPLDDPPRRRGPGADLTFAINPTVRLDDEEEPGGGGPTLTFGEALTLSLEDSNNNSNPDVENFPTIGLEDAGGGGGLIQESNAGNFGSIASQNFPSPKTSKTYDLRDNSTRSEFSKFFTGSNLYDPVYNILKHNAAPSEFVQNTKYRNIFSSRITKEVDYLLSRLNNNSNWEERFITGLTAEKLTLSLNSILREAFDTILDVNGLSLSRNYFLSKVLNHLIKGTLNEFNPDYYINLADSIAKKQSTSITQTVDQQVQKNNILGIMYNNSKPIDYSKYSDFSKIDMARMRFLLTDIESNFYVETIDGTEYELELRDAGAPVDYATFPEQESLGVSSDYVPPGEGDGYYYKIEDENSNLNALVLNTQIDKAYYVTADTRQLALGMLGRDPSYKITASSTLINSEFSSGYYEQYAASAIYFKLDLASIESIPTSDSLVEDITASYKVLTDADETQDHAKTYGGRVAVYHVQYDDPFFQYASRSGKITLNMQDITLRNFAPKRTSTNKIVVRNLPDGLVIYPVSATEDNPTGAYSDLDSMGDVVNRSLYGQISFDNESSDLTRAALTETLIAEAESAYSYGLVGLADTQNYYYTFTPSSFPNSFEVTGRGPAGNLVYNVVNNIKQKYDFTYLTWWDLYRRLSLKDFSTLIFNLPDLVVTNLYQGWLGFPVKDVLNQFGESLNNLTDISPDTSDVVYLDGRSRGNV